MGKLAAASIVVLVLLGAGCGVQEAAADIGQYVMRDLVVDNWVVTFGRQAAVPVGDEVTAMSFCPGSRELAYGTAPDSGPARLWVMPLPDFGDLPGETWEGEPSSWTLAPPSRALWTGPSSDEVITSIWWSADGSRLAVFAGAGERSELVWVDRLSGAPHTIVRDAPVADLAWGLTGRRLAYATERDGTREMWLRDISADRSRRLGPGGLNVRWRLDGTLSWLVFGVGGGWEEMTWDPAGDTVKQTDVVPARTAETLWSPDGRLCAMARAEEEECAIAIHPAGSTVPDVVCLPGVTVERVLGWSPDSRIVLALGEGGYLLAVSARSPGAAVVQKYEVEGRDRFDSAGATARATIPPWPFCDPRVTPTWSAGGAYLAYLVPDRETLRDAQPWQPDSWQPGGRLVVQEVHRRYTTVPDEIQAREARALGSIKQVTLGLMMYLEDSNEISPPVSDANGVAPLLAKYVGWQVFRDPDSEEEEVVISCVVPPGLAWQSIEDPGVTPAVIGDYDPNFIVIGYCDGHAGSLPRTPEWDAKLRQWQETLARLRVDDPQAIPPPFP